MDRRREGLLHRRGTRLRVSRAGPLDRRPAPRQGWREGRRLPILRARAQRRCQLRLPLDRQRRGLGRPRPLYADLYSVAPAGIFVPAGSPVEQPADLAGVPISVGWQSGSHYSTIQALEPYLPADKIELSFKEGLLFRRVEQLVEGQAPAVALFSGPYYFAEQLGFRKVIDTTFMIATMIHGNPDPED